MHSTKKHYFHYLLGTFILTIITIVFCFEFKISYNEMDIFTYARATFQQGFSPEWYQKFQFPSNFLFNWILGFLMSNYNPFKIIILGRVLSYILISYSFIYLSRTLKLTFLTSILTYIIFIYFFKDGIGDAGEWMVGGLESKVFAYSFAIFSLSSFLRKKNSVGFLFAGLALSTHLLIGIYNLFCLIPLLALISYRKKIDFLNIDVEYRDFKALQGINLEDVRPTLIAIEDNDAYDITEVVDSDIYKYLTNKEYFLYSKTNCTNFYLDKKFKNNLNDILNTRNNNSL